MSRTFLIIGGWLRFGRSYRGLIKSAPENSRFIYFHHERALNLPDIKKLLDSQNISKVSIIGHSTGGAIAAQFSGHYPKNIDHLYLIDSEGIFGQEKVFKMFVSILYNNFHHGHKKLSATFYSVLFILLNPILSIKAANFAHFADLKNIFSRLNVPTTILWGEKDVVTPLWQGLEMHKLIKNSKLVVLPEMDHDWILHDPKKFWDNI